MYNPTVQNAFGFSAADSQRYGSTSFGNACLVAKQILAANQGTRYVEITVGSWDMHVDIYGLANPKGNNLYTMAPSLDNGVSALLADLESSVALDETLIVMNGEFGRTAGISAAGGRDHYLNQFAFFAGGGVKGGQVLGTTDATGANILDNGWSQNRPVNPEDIEATIYSAMGIDWTTICYNDPFHRGFEFVPQSLGPDYYNPINGLFK